MKADRYILSVFFAAIVAAAFTSCIGEEVPTIKVKGNGDDKTGNGPSGPYSLSISAGRGQTLGENNGTRAYLDPSDYKYYWDTNEKVSLTVTSKDSYTPLTDLHNVELTGTNTQRTLHANFRGDLLADQFNTLQAQSKVDLYSYYPSGIHGLNNGAFPSSLQFTIPTSFTVAPNTFISSAYAPMVAAAKNKEPNITFTPGLNPARPVEEIGGVHLNYNHVLSYAAIEMDVKLLPDKVTAITMTVGNALNDDTRINGTYTYDVASGTGQLSSTGGSNSVTINIPAGLDTGEVIYIPMPVKYFNNETFKFTFVTASSNGNVYRDIPATARNLNFEKGKIHRIKVAPAAEYKSGTSFTVTKAGYYYIEAWGGDGGKGVNESNSRPGGTGGVGATVKGLYYLEANQTINVQVGGAAPNASGYNTNTNGGIPIGNNYGLGNGGNGGNGQNINNSNKGNAGAGGGAASGVIHNNNIIVVAGGAGGGGGASTSGWGDGSSSIGGNGGNGGSITPNANNETNSNDGSGYNPSKNNDYDGGGGNANGNGGSGGGGNNSGYNGGAGGNAYTGSWDNYSAGSGGGGGGGGYNHGGGGGGGGCRGTTLSPAGAGGGGAGGASYSRTVSSYPGAYTQPNNERPSGRKDGYVIITHIR